MLNTANANASDDVTEYSSVSGKCLENVTVQYRHSISLAEGESLQFPATFVLTFSGYRTNDFQESACSGAGEGNIQLTKDENYKLYLSFTGDDGQRYDDIGMFQGPYSEGDRFLLGGNVYEYDSAEPKSNTGACDSMELYFKNLLRGGKDKLELTAYTGSDILLTTYAFEESAENDEDISIDPDSDCNSTDVFTLLNVEGVSGVDLLYNGGEIYFVNVQNSSYVANSSIGIWGTSVYGASGQV